MKSKKGLQQLLRQHLSSRQYLPSRRHLLKAATSGFGYLAFSSLAAWSAQDEQKREKKDLLAPKPAHFSAKAKHVILLCMRGGPTHVDTFDYKPQLTKDTGKPGRYGRNLFGSPWKFSQRGESGLWISDLFPHVAKMADELCLLNGMHCDQPIHLRAEAEMHTGSSQFLRPSLGAWSVYGLGTDNSSMPGFVSLNPPSGSAQNYGSSFLPSVYQGTKVNAKVDASAIPDIINSKISKAAQRDQIDFIQQLNQQKLAREKQQPMVDGIIDSYELAFRMQGTLPQLMDLSKETKQTLDEYGVGKQPMDQFARQCVLARRFVESGVRFVAITDDKWDHHGTLGQELTKSCKKVDQPIAALLRDLKQRGLLDETLILWGGEFGRTPEAQNGTGRDHNNNGYTTWMAGGGVKGGYVHGATDEYGYEAVEGKVHIHDWHATILHLMGLDHERLTYRYAGREFRLTDVYGNVVNEIIA